jgi:fructokinase
LLTPALVTVIGEALIDLVPWGDRGDYRAHPGGSPFNVSVALARLGNRTALMARLADHGFGRLLRDAALAENVDLAATANASEPATLAVVSLDGPGHARYDFYLKGTADWKWTLPELRRLPSETAIVHYGSIASWTPPGSKLIDQAVCAARSSGVLITYDPNIRPPVLRTAARGRQLVERSVRRAHVVKASREDVEWLYPSLTTDEVAARWTELGAALVVVTDGAAGAMAHRGGAWPLRRRGRRVKVVDTIGAGDAFTAGFLNGLVRRDLHSPERVAEVPDADLADVVDEAVLISSLTCERSGADPPRLANGRAMGHTLTVEDFVTP